MAAAKDKSPTVSEFLNAANWEYQKIGLPADLTPFTVNGQQLTYTNQHDGISAAVWETPEKQLVVSYEGTQAISFTAAALDPGFSFRQVVEDTGIAQGKVTAGEQDAAAFARSVLTVARGDGIGAGDVFVTGHSLGGIQAEYVAQQTGLGGVGFETTGIARSATHGGSGTNFVNVVQYGDPVANYSSDISAEQPFAPAYARAGTGALPHYGYVAMIGDPTAEAALRQEAHLSALGATGVGLTTAAYGVDLAAYHVPDVQAYSLGVTLSQYGAAEVAGVRSGPVLDAADYTIDQLIAATQATYSPPTGPSSTISPTHGASAGAAAVLLDQSANFTQTTHADAAATLLDDLLLPRGGVDAVAPGFTSTVLSRLFMTGETDIAGTLAQALNTVAHHGAGSILPELSHPDTHFANADHALL